jgi:hypothetical protein
MARCRWNRIGLSHQIFNAVSRSCACASTGPTKPTRFHCSASNMLQVVLTARVFQAWRHSVKSALGSASCRIQSFGAATSYNVCWTEGPVVQ